MTQEKQTLKSQAADAAQLAFSVPGQAICVTPEVAKQLGFFADDAVLADDELDDYLQELMEEHS